MPTKHALGWGNGRIIEYEDGTAAYIAGATLTHAFRVKIADVTGFSVTKNGKMLERQLTVLGNGTTLASVGVPHGTSEKIEAWFKNHPNFAQAAAGTAAATRQATPSPAPPSLVADELQKLAELRDQGVLTDTEFAAQKAKLLGS